MSSVDQLLLVLLAIYASECIFYLPATALAVGKWLGRGKLLDGGLSVGPSGGGLLMAEPFPWSVTYLSGAWPVAVSFRGLLSLAGCSKAESGVDESGAISWEAVQSVRADGRWLLVNGLRFAECATSTLAVFLAKRLMPLQATSPEKRNAAIRAALADSLNEVAAQQRCQQIASGLWQLRLGGIILFATVFVLVPIADRVLPVWQWAPWVVLAVLVQSLVNAWLLRRVLRHCGELSGEDRFKAKLVSLVSPVASMRAAQLAASHALALHHPLAIAGAVGGNEFFHAVAERYWREANYPVAPSDANPFARQIMADFSALLGDEVAACLRRHQLDAASLLATPAPDSPEVTVYCPRCLGQYLSQTSACPNCGNAVLLPMPT